MTRTPRGTKNKSAKQILDMLKEAPLTIKKISEEIGYGDYHVKSLMTKLRKSGKVEPESVYIPQLERTYTFWRLATQILNKETIENNYDLDLYFQKSFSFPKSWNEMKNDEMYALDP